MIKFQRTKINKLCFLSLYCQANPLNPKYDFYDVLIIGAGPSGIFTAYEAKKIIPIYAS
jgi:ribulose 1,5-bisphosphate synthetase/thiazole synthase